MDMLLLSLGQMGKLFFFILCGYLLRKVNIITNSVGHDLSSLLLWVFMPLYIINNLSKNASRDSIAESGMLILVSVIFLVVTFIIAHILAKFFAKTEFEKAIYEYSFTFANYGYIGYPMIQFVFGEEMLAKNIIFCLTYTIVVYTWGAYRLDPSSGLNLKKLIKPSTVAVFVGFFIGFFDIQLPSVVSNVISSAASCLSPIAMILTGAVCARQPLLKMFREPRVYLASLIRLVAIPAVVGAAAYFVGLSPIILIIGVSTIAMPMGLNTIIFSEANGADSSLGAQLCVVSNIMGIITIPLVYTVLSLIAA